MVNGALGNVDLSKWLYFYHDEILKLKAQRFNAWGEKQKPYVTETLPLAAGHLALRSKRTQGNGDGSSFVPTKH